MCKHFTYLYSGLISRDFLVSSGNSRSKPSLGYRGPTADIDVYEQLTKLMTERCLLLFSIVKISLAIVQNRRNLSVLSGNKCSRFKRLHRNKLLL